MILIFVNQNFRVPLQTSSVDTDVLIFLIYFHNIDDNDCFLKTLQNCIWTTPDQLGWESLSDQRRCRLLLYLDKILANKTPPYLKEILSIREIFNNEGAPPILNNQSRYYATERNKSTFFAYSIKNWNVIITILHQCPHSPD